MSKKCSETTDRLEQQYRRLRTRNPVCVACSESYPFCLELHHLAARKHHDDVSVVCRNCHRKLSDGQHDHATIPTSETEGALTKIGHYLLGLADFLMMIVTTLREFGKQLIGPSHART